MPSPNISGVSLGLIISLAIIFGIPRAGSDPRNGFVEPFEASSIPLRPGTHLRVTLLLLARVASSTDAGVSSTASV